jgi:hypothetical protein
MKTKKSTLSILFCGFLILATSCGSKNDPQALPDPIQKEIITQIFAAGSDVSGVSYVRPSKTIANQLIFKSPTSATTTVPIPANTSNGPNGGTITVSGNMDIISASADAGTNMSMTISEVFSSFGIIAQGNTYTMTGTILYTGSLIISPTIISGKFTTNGSLTVVGTGYNKQMAINLTETMSENVNISTGTITTTVTVTGTIDGQTINYTVTK